MRVSRHAVATALLLILVTGLPACTEGGPDARPESARRVPSGRESPIRFYREYVTVEPSHDRTCVTGLYYFRNDSDDALAVGILYPFPVDRHHLYPLRIAAWEETDDGARPLGFARVAAGVRWSMDFFPREEKLIRVRYTQEIKKPHAIYIVTTTQKWERPIELAEFEFRIPRSLEGATLSFDPDRSEVRGDTLVYFVAWTDFMPDTDLTVTWDR
jgi:hypothetical protein